MKVQKNLQKIYFFEDNCGSTCCGNFSQLPCEYLWAAGNMLQKAPTISETTKRHDTQLNFFDINGKLAWKCSHADFSSVLDLLTR